MLDLPEFGTTVRVWPFPGRKVQATERAIGLGGSFLPPDGATIRWSPFALSQLRQGDILLHAPPTEEQIEEARKAQAEAKDNSTVPLHAPAAVVPDPPKAPAPAHLPAKE